MKIICFDIGSTKILKAVIELNGRNYKFLETKEEKNPRNEKKIREILINYSRNARKISASGEKTKKIAISAAYIVNPVKKTISGGKVCYGTDSFGYKFLEKEGFNVRAENDGRCFALGEYYFGKGKDKKSILGLTLGTGIGGGFIDNGNILRGHHFSALEAGRTKVFVGGKWREWEWVAAGRGIEKFYLEAGKEKISAEGVFERARKGELLARKVLAQAQEVFGVGISNLLNILDPEIAVIGGGISGQKKFVAGAIKIAKKNALNKKANYQFAVSALGNKANLLGAVKLFL